jgi:hypothetical protein
MSRPQTLHWTFESIGVTRVQKETIEPGRATVGKGCFRNSGMMSSKLSADSSISTFDWVLHFPNLFETVQEYLPESNTKGS